MAQRYAVNAAQVDVNQVNKNYEAALSAHAAQVKEAADLAEKLAKGIKVRAFFTGTYVSGIELWDCQAR